VADDRVITFIPHPEEPEELPAPHLHLALSIGWHWNPDRVAETAIVEDGAPVSRHTPPFRDEDTVVSAKTPMTFRRTSSGALLFTPSSVPTFIDNEPVNGPIEFPAARLAAGIPIFLARRLVIVVHLRTSPVTSEPARAGAHGSARRQRYPLCSESMVQLQREVEHSKRNVLILSRSPVAAAALAAQIGPAPQIELPPVFLNSVDEAKGHLFGAGDEPFRGEERKYLRENPADFVYWRGVGVFEAIEQEGSLFIEETFRIPPAVRDLLLEPLDSAKQFAVDGPTRRTYSGRVICATKATDEELSVPQVQKLLARFPFTLRVPPLTSRRADIGPAILTSLAARYFPREIARENPQVEPFLRSDPLVRCFSGSFPTDEDSLDALVDTILKENRAMRPFLVI